MKDPAILVLSDSTVKLHCLNKQASSRSRSLPQLSEKVLLLAAKRDLFLQASHLAERYNLLVDALSRQNPSMGLAAKGHPPSMVEWTLSTQLYNRLVKIFETP